MGTRVRTLEEKGSLSEKDKAIVPRLGLELERLDEHHENLHLEVIDLITDDDEGATEQKEQKDYEEYEDTVNDIQGRIQILLFDIETAKFAEVSVYPVDKINKPMDHIEEDLEKINGVIDAMVSGASVSLLEVPSESRLRHRSTLRCPPPDAVEGGTGLG